MPPVLCSLGGARGRLGSIARGERRRAQGVTRGTAGRVLTLTQKTTVESFVQWL